MEVSVEESINESIESIFKKPSLKRNYTITNERDNWNIENGRCPDYALNWTKEVNIIYWNEGHDYLKGPLKSPTQINEDQYKYFEIWRQITIKIAEKKALNENPIKIICSLDGLVCNIDDDIIELNLSTYGIQLWKVIKQMNPVIILEQKYFTPEKIEWCKINLDLNIKIITFQSYKEKKQEDQTILIDNIKDKKYIKDNKLFIQHTNIIKTLSNILHLL